MRLAGGGGNFNEEIDISLPELSDREETTESFSSNNDSFSKYINMDHGEGYTSFNFINANARSMMNNKIESLIKSFDEYNLSAAILTETWFKNGTKLQQELEDLEAAEELAVIAKNRGTIKRRWSCCGSKEDQVKHERI